VGPTLVLLAAGIGRRFGGLKQLAPVGPNGQAILDLTIADAANAGFQDVVLVVRHSIVDEIAEHLCRRPCLPVQFAFQDDLRPSRGGPGMRCSRLRACWSGRSRSPTPTTTTASTVCARRPGGSGRSAGLMPGASWLTA
jgi:hypothetical protein